MKFKKFIYLFVVVFFFFGINLASYNDNKTEQESEVDNTGSPTSLNNPLGDRTPEILIGDLINTIFGIVGSLALLMFIYGGLTWMTSAGNKEMVDKGRNIIKWAAIGLVIIFSSYALVRFLIIGVGAA
jgi:cbb3-type cytochrome oxidase subunit 3